jgi:hypothetical protein
MPVTLRGHWQCQGAEGQTDNFKSFCGPLVMEWRHKWSAAGCASFCDGSGSLNSNPDQLIVWRVLLLSHSTNDFHHPRLLIKESEGDSSSIQVSSHHHGIMILSVNFNLKSILTPFHCHLFRSYRRCGSIRLSFVPLICYCIRGDGLICSSCVIDDLTVFVVMK